LALGFPQDCGLSGSLSTPTGEVPVRVTLTETGGFWYIDTVTVSGVPLQ